MRKPIFEKTDLSWVVCYDYERSRCTCNDDICRCTTIERIWVYDVDVGRAVKKLYNKYHIDSTYIDMYCFDRICHAFKIYDKSLYEVETGYGYYGEEVCGVWFENEDSIYSTYINSIDLETILEKVKYCLNLEYGYLIDCVKSATSASIIEVSIDDIRIPQMEYFRKIDKEVVEDYKNRDLPVAVCVKNGDKYRLIDGYHRYVANKDKERVYIIALE